MAYRCSVQNIFVPETVSHEFRTNPLLQREIDLGEWRLDFLGGVAVFHGAQKRGRIRFAMSNLMSVTFIASLICREQGDRALRLISRLPCRIESTTDL